MLTSDAPFYLAINHKRNPEDKVWYLNRHLGKRLLKESTEAALGKENQQGLKRKLTNHSVRKTSIGRLLDANVEANYVAQLSGHKNLKSLDSYKSASLQNQKAMSAILNNGSAPSTSSSTVTVQTQSASTLLLAQKENFKPQAIFAGANIEKFEGCTFNVNVFCQQPEQPQNQDKIAS